MCPFSQLPSTHLRYIVAFNLVGHWVGLEFSYIMLACSNHLLINPDKSKFLVFGSRQMLSRTAVPPIMFLGKDLLIVDWAKDLGVVLDSQLSFNEHINSLVSSLMSKLCMVNRISHLLDHSTLIIVINLLVFGKLFTVLAYDLAPVSTISLSYR